MQATLAVRSCGINGQLSYHLVDSGRRPMKRSALYLLVSLLFASVSLAQQNAADTPASKEDVERYMVTLHQRELVSSMMVTMKQQMHQTVAEQVKKQPSLPSDFVARMDRMFD